MVSEIRNFEAQHWVKTRASLDSSQSIFLVWTGKIYAFVPDEKTNCLFSMVGVNVSRCLPTEEGSWQFTSRELTYYLDPETGEKLHQWKNSWTKEVVTVMHVANNPVQDSFRGTFPAQVDGDNTTFIFDIFSTYPNPLGTDPKFAQYSPNPIYQSGELFKITVPTEEVLNPKMQSVSKLQLCWDRIGPWVPWMKMGNLPGHLIYSAYGSKVDGVSDLPPLLQEEITHRLPLYKNAPQSYLEVENVTSWLYFQKHFDAYLAGETFPLPETK